MSIHLKILTVVTFISFALIEKANFRLDPDNIGLFASIAVGAFIYKYFFIPNKPW